MNKYIEQYNNKCNNTSTEDFLSKKRRMRKVAKRQHKNEGKENIKDENKNQQKVNDLSREILKTIKKDIREYKNEKIIQTIEKNKSIKEIRKKFKEGKK